MIWINDGFLIKFGFYIENSLEQVIMQFIDDYTTWKIISKQGKHLLDLPYHISP